MERIRKIPLFYPLAFWCLCGLALLLIVLHGHGLFLPGWQALRIEPKAMIFRDNLGAHAYQVNLDKAFAEEIAASPYPALVFEDGLPLPEVHEDAVGRFRVGREGAGNFVLQKRRLLFSATDNSDPRTNGKRYEVGVPRRIDDFTANLFAGLFTLATLLLIGFLYVRGGLALLGRAAILLGFNVLLIAVLMAGFEWLLARTAADAPGAAGAEERLPYDSNYARNDLTYYRPDEVLDESGGLWTWGIQVKKNALGFREREIAIPKPAGTYRVMLLGDSYTFGIGLEPEQRFSNLAEALLEKQYPQGKIEVLNFGQPGADLNDEHAILEKTIGLVRPDLIVVAFCANDFMASYDLYQVRKKQFDRQYGPGVDFLTNALRRLKLVHTAAAFRRALDGFLVQSGFLPAVETASLQLLNDESAEEGTFRYALTGIKRLSDEAGLAEPVFVILNQSPLTRQPSAYDNLSASLPIQLRLFHKAEMLAAAAGFRHYNHEEEILREKPTRYTINAVDEHPSAELNRIYAEKLAAVIGAVLASEDDASPNPR